MLAVGCGLVLQVVRSPAQNALDAAPPERSTLTAEVVQTTVAARIVGRGLVAPAIPTVIPLPVVPESKRSVISASPLATGDEARAGDVLVALAGRPVIVLSGAVPAYRDLRPGDKGEDVAQLQRALTELGRTVEADGTYGEGTEAGVRWLYETRGYQVPSTTGLGDPADPEILAAEALIREEERRVADLQAGTAGQSETGADKFSDVDTRRQVERAREDLRTAQDALTRARAISGPMLPLSEVVYVSSLPAYVAVAPAAVGRPPADPVAVLSTSDLVIEGEFSAAQVERIVEGMPADVELEATGWTGTARVQGIEQRTGAAEGDPTTTVVRLVPDAALPTDLAGQNLKVTIIEGSTSGEVLAVPIAAVTVSADGSAYVVRQDARDEQEKVVVRVGVVGDGLVEVAVVDGDLAVGDMVVTSR